MVKDYNRHIVISVSGSQNSGKTGVSRFIQEALCARGVEAELIESIPGDSGGDGISGSEIIEMLKAQPKMVDVVIMDVSGRRSPINEFKMMLATMDDKLSLELGATFLKADEKTKNSLRRNHLRDKCRQFGIPVSLAALIAPSLTGTRGLWDVVE